MIIRLFSIFDPSIYSFFSPWFVVLLLFLFFYSYWFCGSIYYFFFSYFRNFISTEFNSVVGPNNKTTSVLFLYGAFFFIFFLNYLSLYPSFFTVTGHLVFSFSFSFVFWSLLIYFYLLNNSYSFFRHIVPIGTPNILMPFIVLVELVSNLIRPITLCVRLVANIVAGHLLITLLGNFLVGSGFVVFSLGLASGFILLILELAVSFIQGYVFLTLFSLYSDECH